LLNVRGYYRGLIDFLDHALGERFITEVHRALILVAEEPEELLARFEHYRAPPAVKGVVRPKA
jgi:predicted Rossmann-fold nucleotide-binding protein